MIELGLALMLMAGAADTVSVNVAVAFETPLPLAVTVMVWLLTGGALAAAWSVKNPLEPVSGEAIVAVTPVGRLLIPSVTLPI